MTHNSVLEWIGKSPVNSSPSFPRLVALDVANKCSIATFSLTPGKANFAFENITSSYGAGPRTFDISSDGLYLAIGDQLSGDVVIYSRDPHTELLQREIALANVVAPTNSTGMGLSSVIFDQ